MTTSTPSSIGNYITEKVYFSDDFKSSKQSLVENIERQNFLLNRKDTGQYETVEIQNNQTFPGPNSTDKRYIFRKIIETGTLPNNATSTIAHGIAGINNNWMFTRIYGSARNPTTTQFIPMPDAGPNYQVQLMVDNTNIYIRTAVDLTGFTFSYVILEYYKG